eukprot:CAMPEP_0180667090 /NCGR_PEP_ID=MMETSP1037_2-20121125/62178_1 /TAXON_ID=632150 /ORGANISM="Azadinium spinosum, Strain 3D9" /LENGTH=115 /DNA_ID=CAMNT_0022695673 /DNA_START=1 /DNA_END=344 /DNA_ORIENTATION=+
MTGGRSWRETEDDEQPRRFASMQETTDLVAGMCSALLSACPLSPRADVFSPRFVLTVADPHLPDVPLIAVSDGFCELTGYARDDVLSKNCRFMNDGCEVKDSVRTAMRIAATTGG